MSEARDDLTATIATLEQERDKIRNAMIDELNEVEQALGAALGYPYYCDDPANFPDAIETDGVCVGEHTVATLAREAAQHIATLTADNAHFKAEIAILKARTWQPVPSGTWKTNPTNPTYTIIVRGGELRATWNGCEEDQEVYVGDYRLCRRVVAEEEANNGSQ